MLLLLGTHTQRRNRTNPILRATIQLVYKGGKYARQEYHGSVSDHAAADNDLKAPLYEVLATIAALWALANAGYFFIFPALGYPIDYNEAPVAIAVYFLFWTVLSINYFRRLFSTWLAPGASLWVYGALSFGFAGAIVALVHVFSHFPALQGPELAPYTDLLLSTPWYFLPKAVEVWMQQILITILVLELHYRLGSYKKVLVAYAATFGLAHVLLFALSSAPGAYATIMTVAALGSTWVFPRLILRVRGGLVYAYVIHLMFYILLAMFLHAWPPPGYTLAAPAAQAQAPSHVYDYWTSQAGAITPQSISEWRHSSTTVEQKIARLDKKAAMFLPMPVFGVGPQEIEPNFGVARLIGRTHEGQDILAPAGSTIVSPTEAVVIQAGVAAREGIYVVTANPGDETFVYMHLSSAAPGVTAGASLSQSALVGYVGTSGNAAGGPPMLHFEIRDKDGAPTDPYPRLAGRLVVKKTLMHLPALLAPAAGTYTPLIYARPNAFVSALCALLPEYGNLSRFLCGS